MSPANLAMKGHKSTESMMTSMVSIKGIREEGYQGCKANGHGNMVTSVYLKTGMLHLVIFAFHKISSL
jgi:hypothetical protein